MIHSRTGSCKLVSVMTGGEGKPKEQQGRRLQLWCAAALLSGAGGDRCDRRKRIVIYAGFYYAFTKGDGGEDL